jgi:antitoxin (DNA-binding transcriptional repressor) of toxin-antitoxin stability system
MKKRASSCPAHPTEISASLDRVAKILFRRRDRRSFTSPNRLLKCLLESDTWAPAMKVSAKELRQKTRLVLDAVERGEEVTITYRGRARAQILRLDNGQQPAESASENELFGLWADRDDLIDPPGWVRALRKSRYP